MFQDKKFMRVMFNHINQIFSKYILYKFSKKNSTNNNKLWLPLVTECNYSIGMFLKIAIYLNRKQFEPVRHLRERTSASIPASYDEATRPRCPSEWARQRERCTWNK